MRHLGPFSPCPAGTASVSVLSWQLPVFSGVLICVLALLPAASAQVFSNGDFEQTSPYATEPYEPDDYLYRWYDSWTGYPDTDKNYVQVEESGGNHWGHMHAEGSWSYWAYGEAWQYQECYARLEQSQFIPIDATELTLDYRATIVDSTGEGLANPAVMYQHNTTGDAEFHLPAAADWTTTTVPVPESVRGRSVWIEFRAQDDGGADVSDSVGTTPPAANLVDFHIDNVSMNGSQQRVAVSWQVTDGGAWENAANWSTPDGPNNTPAAAYSVSLRHPTFGEPLGPNTVTLSTDVELQSLDVGDVDGLRITGGMTLAARDNIMFSDSNIVMEPGSKLINGSIVSDPMYVRGGSITALGGTGAVSRIEVNAYPSLPLRLQGPGGENTGGPVLDLTDCVVDVNGSAYPVAGIYDETQLTFTRSPACTERVGLLCRDVWISTGSSVTFNPGTGAYDGARIAVASYKGTSEHAPTLNLNSAQMGGPADENKIGNLTNHGVTNITGTTTFHTTGFSISNGQYEPSRPDAVLNVTDADLWLSGDFWNGLGGRANIVRSVVEANCARFQLDAGSQLAVDGDSKLICNSFLNFMEDGDAFEMGDATLELTGCEMGYANLYCPGADHGTSMAGYTDNFAIGTVRVMGDAMLHERGGDNALYLTDLYLAEGTELNLNGVALYYRGAITGGGTITGGVATLVPEPGTLLLLGLAICAMLTRRSQ